MVADQVPTLSSGSAERHGLTCHGAGAHYPLSTCDMLELLSKGWIEANRLVVGAVIAIAAVLTVVHLVRRRRPR